jgi:hypothetical protein
VKKLSEQEIKARSELKSLEGKFEIVVKEREELSTKLATLTKEFDRAQKELTEAKKAPVVTSLSSFVFVLLPTALL